MKLPPPPHALLSRLLRVLALLVFVAPEAGVSRTVDLKVLQTTDIHAFVEETDRLPEGGGWLRVATLIRREREAHGRDRTLLVDCGDTCQGSLVGQLSGGQVAADLLAALEYDVWVPGNHELDFGGRRLWELAAAHSSRTLCGNLWLSLDGRERSFRAWRLFERGGARIAVIGATASYLRQWLWGRGLEGYRVAKAAALLSTVLPEVVAAKPHLIVLAIHQGWLSNDRRGVNEVAELVDRFPDIDLILGGHTHRTLAGMILGRRTWYVQAGAHAAYLGVVDVKLDLARGEVLDISSQLVEAGPQVPIDVDAANAVGHWLQKARAAGRESVGTLAEPLSASGRPGETCQTSELICRAIAEATSAEAVVHGRLSKADLSAGEVTRAHLFSVVPYENSLAVAHLLPGEIREIIAEQFTQRKSYAYCGVWGLEVLTASPDRTIVRLLDANGQELPGRRVPVAFNSYTVAGGGGRFPRLREILRRPEARLQDTGINSRDALAAYITRHQPVRLTVRRWVRPASRSR